MISGKVGIRIWTRRNWNFFINKKKTFSNLFFLILNRSPPRPSRDHERCRSPPTIQQSTQRTIVYMQESSHFRYEKTDLLIIIF
jgi:hypothetical protein